MKTLNLQQGTDAWHQARAKHHTASEAPAMKGASSKATRSELLRMKATGSGKEFSEWVENVLFARGHEIEAKARPIAEAIIGDDLFPVTATDDDGYLLASFDGITMLEDVCWECKQWNKDKAAAVREGVVPDEDYWQVVQQLAVSGAEKCLYMVTDGTEENTVHCWVYPNQGDIKKLLAGWAQFDKDLANYEHKEHKEAPAGAAPGSLPALHIQVKGEVTASNLAAFKTHALAIFEGISTDLQTDQDFANADATTKWCKEVEDKLELAKEQALAQTASIDELFRTIEEIKEQARAKRLELGKLVKDRKDAIRGEIVAAGKQAVTDHFAQINATLGGKITLPVPADLQQRLAGAVKGKRTVSSLHDAVDTEVAHIKIESNETADRVRLNLETLRTEAGEFRHLFADAQQLVMAENDHLQLVIKDRIREHKEAEDRRLEAERERIRAEEKAKAEAEAARAEAQRQREEAAKREAEARAAREAERAAVEDAERAQVAEAKSHGAVAAEPARAEIPAASVRTQRPTDRQIIATLAHHYGVSESVAIEWIITMDLSEIAA